MIANSYSRPYTRFFIRRARSPTSLRHFPLISGGASASSRKAAARRWKLSQPPPVSSDAGRRRNTSNI
jgi:hypothetical protein